MNSQLGILTENNSTILIVQNIKCSGCARTITKSLQEISLNNIEVDPSSSSVRFNTPLEGDILIQKAIEKLKNLGYPLINTQEGLAAMQSKAKSFISCFIGKVNSNE